MKCYPTQLRLSIQGCDRSADGVLVIQLPCPPSVGLHIADIYSQEPLYVDDVTVGCLTHRIIAWCSRIADEDLECHVLAKLFVGEWEWTYYPTPPHEDDGNDDNSDEPTFSSPPESSESRSEISDDWYAKMIANTIRRGTAHGDN